MLNISDGYCEHFMHEKSTNITMKKLNFSKCYSVQSFMFWCWKQQSQPGITLSRFHGLAATSNCCRGSKATSLSMDTSLLQGEGHLLERSTTPVAARGTNQHIHILLSHWILEPRTKYTISIIKLSYCNY